MADGATSATEHSPRLRGREALPFAVVVTPLPPGANVRPLIDALARQAGLGHRSVTVFAGVSERLGAAAAAFEALGDDGSLELHLLDGELPPTEPAACREVIRAAAYHLRRHAEGSDPALLMLDGETIPAPDWVASNLRALTEGVDLVCGNPLPLARRAEGQRPPDVDALVRYIQLAVRLEELLDPVPWDPAPRHRDESGASLAFRLSRLERAGGVPEVPVDTCRHLIARLRQSGGALRHCPRTRVFVPPARLLAAEARRCVADAELPTPVPDPEYLERSFRRRSRLRSVLNRRYAHLSRVERNRAIQSQLALATAAADVSPRALPVEQACAVLRKRLEELGDCQEGRAAAARVGYDERQRSRPSIW